MTSTEALLIAIKLHAAGHEVKVVLRRKRPSTVAVIIPYPLGLDESAKLERDVQALLVKLEVPYSVKWDGGGELDVVEM